MALNSIPRCPNGPGGGEQPLSAVFDGKGWELPQDSVIP